MKTRKKRVRKMDNYAVGSGATGTIKNYMPNPNEVFRQNEIDIDRAKAEAASNPWVVGLDMLGAVTTQVGMSIAGSGAGGEVTGDLPDNAIDVDQNFMDNMDTPDNFMLKGAEVMDTQQRYAATGTDKYGMGTTKGEFEGGELLEYPDGQMEEMTGASHAQGGITKDVPDGTLVHSDFDENSMPGADPKFVKSIMDYLSVDGKTPAEAKKSRMRKLNKVSKKLEEDGSDVVNKETHKRLSEKDAIADEMNFEKQGKVRQMVEAYDYAFGTDEEGIEAFGWGSDAWGVVKKGAVDYAKGFTGGDLMGMAGTIYSGFAGRKNAMDNAATDRPNENLYEGYADEALASIDQAGGMLDTNRALAEKKINLNQNKQINKGRNTARGVNQMRALDANAFVTGNQALDNLYGSFSQMMMENLYKKSQLQATSGQVEAKGATAADIANRMDKDINDSNLAAANQNFATAMQVTGKDLNANKRNTMLTNLTAQLSKHGLKFDGQGNIING